MAKWYAWNDDLCSAPSAYSNLSRVFPHVFFLLFTQDSTRTFSWLLCVFQDNMLMDK